MTIFGQKVVIHAIQMPFFFTGSAVAIFVPIFDYFTLGVLAVWEEIREEDPWW